MRKTILLFLAAAAFGLNGCYYDNEEELYPNSFCNTASVTYSSSIAPIIQSKCVGCHSPGGSGPGDFNVFANVAEQVANGKLLLSVKRDPSGIPMPPGSPLTSCEIQKFELWIAAGANND